jgi:predicted aspartyl protease
VIIHIDDSPVKFKVDTGAQCNVLPKQIFDKVVKTLNLQAGPRVTAYNRQPVSVVGQQQLGLWTNCDSEDRSQAFVRYSE